jgi:hypothetical protein
MSSREEAQKAQNINLGKPILTKNAKRFQINPLCDRSGPLRKDLVMCVICAATTATKNYSFNLPD